MDIIFWGTYNTTMAVLPQMTERKNGRIVNIASVGGKASIPHLLSYSTAKFAVEGFSTGLHAELAKDGIVVTTVSPGLMRTGSAGNAIVKGNEHQQEYALFALADSLPGLSIDVRRAARQVFNATRRGETDVIITYQAQILGRLFGAFPGLTTDLLSVVNRFLPSGEGQGTARYTGKGSETPVSQSFLTGLNQKAADRYNENL
jgi:short-subunit dehydrogenase